MAKETLKEEAQRVLKEVHENEHREQMRIYSLIHNGLLWLLVIILCCSFGTAWFLLLLILTDWSYSDKK